MEAQFLARKSLGRSQKEASDNQSAKGRPNKTFGNMFISGQKSSQFGVRFKFFEEEFDLLAQTIESANGGQIQDGLIGVRKQKHMFF